MTVLTDVAHVHARLAASGVWPDSGEDADRLLRTNWDVWASVDGDDMFMGMARAPHLAIMHDIDLAARGLRPVLAPHMGTPALHAALWRQLQVMPDDYHERCEEETAGSNEVACASVHPGRNAYAPLDGLNEPARAEHIRRLIGHSPLDLAEFLKELLRTDLDLGKLLLAKNFKTALRMYPAAINLPWPVQTTRRWKITGGRNYLPPVVALAAFAELARLSHNAAAHIWLTFDDAGQELFLGPVLKDATNLAADEAVLRTIELAAFGSTALLPPADLLLAKLEHDQLVRACTAWTINAAAAATLNLAAYHESFPSDLLQSATPAWASARSASFATHPRFWLIPRGSKGSSLPKGHAAAWWGMNWRMHAVSGLLDIADQAREWSRRYRQGRDILPKLERELERSAAAILYLWVEAVHPKALPKALRYIVDGINNVAARQAREQGRQLPTPISHNQRVEDLIDGESFGVVLGGEARQKLALAPGPGEQGYTARYRFHLWFDDEGDDLHHYARHQKRAVKRMKRVLGDPEEAPASGSGANRNVFRLEPRQRPEARKLCRWLNEATSRSHVLAARDCAMMMLPPATDLINIVNAAPRHWAAWKSSELWSPSAEGAQPRNRGHGRAPHPD